jgi:hypothetical protein
MNLSAAALLELWERGSTEPSLLAPVVLLSAASGEPQAELARLPVGERDLRLLELYRSLRGRRVEGVSQCPSCHEPVETAFDVDALLSALRERPSQPLTCSSGAWRATWRLPSTADLLAVAAAGPPGAMRDALLRRCLTETWRGRKRVAAEDAPPELLDAAEAAMQRADPAGDVRLALTCPECAHEWEVALDAATFVRAEVSARARQVANEVHLLASAYGWREGDILAMSPARRQLYISQAYG